MCFKVLSFRLDYLRTENFVLVFLKTESIKYFLKLLNAEDVSLRRCTVETFFRMRMKPVLASLVLAPRIRGDMWGFFYFMSL